MAATRRTARQRRPVPARQRLPVNSTAILRRQRARKLGRRPVNSGTLYDILPTLLADLAYFGQGFLWVLFTLIIPFILATAS